MRPREAARRNPALRRRVSLLVIAVVAVAVGAAVVIAVALVQRWAFTAAATPPGVGTTVIAPHQSKAQRALAEDGSDAEIAATEYLAAQPTAYWLTPEQDPPGAVGRTVTALTSQARNEDAAVAVVVYGLPGRDCGSHSAGGLAASEYPAWVSEIADALEAAPDVQKVVVLEPDSLALAPSCGDGDQRFAQLRAAAHELSGPDTWIYLDGGHSGWLPAAEMATLISRVDAGTQVRGFATNVSNYRATHDEFAYAHELSGHLGGMHAIVDTSRNGAATAGAEWCNPAGQRVGEPSGTFGDDVVDMNLWVKPPGESDGPCNGGPAAGVWWPEGAVTLAGASAAEH
ncbi:glycoside hydrolase family 6 protein [Microbacterium sp. Mu-80]|uniref:Glucanase n=1 Tax=Microbacterium bandirmense TaxID=3122050 RepID=A0ABU8LFA8_9MICO